MKHCIEAIKKSQWRYKQVWFSSKTAKSVKLDIYCKKEWNEQELQRVVDQYWALEPEVHHWAVYRIAIACGVPCQTLDNHIKGKH